MKLIREALEVDFFFDPKPLTKKEQKMISDFIKADKERRKKTTKKGTHARQELNENFLFKGEQGIQTV